MLMSKGLLFLLIMGLLLLAISGIAMHFIFDGKRPAAEDEKTP